MDDFRAAAGNGETTNAAKLMDRGETAHHRIVADLNVTSECSVVGEDDFVSDSAIVTNVAISQKNSAIPHPRFSFARSAAIHRHEFTKRVLVSNFQICRLTLVF